MVLLKGVVNEIVYKNTNLYLPNVTKAIMFYVLEIYNSDCDKVALRKICDKFDKFDKSQSDNRFSESCTPIFNLSLCDILETIEIKKCKYGNCEESIHIPLFQTRKTCKNCKMEVCNAHHDMCMNCNEVYCHACNVYFLSVLCDGCGRQICKYCKSIKQYTCTYGIWPAWNWCHTCVRYTC
jgi:hypothetical protein